MRPRARANARVGAAACGALVALLLAGCVPDEADTYEQAVSGLQDQVVAAHAAMLEHRSRHPEAAGPDAVAVMDQEYLFPGSRVDVHEDGTVEVVLTVASSAENGGGLSYTQAVVGACIAIEVVPGDGVEDGHRGQVTTTTVPCPAGLEPENGGSAASQVERDFGVLHDDVPAESHVPGPCYGTTGDCPGG
jgi:hypothetical protein